MSKADLPTVKHCVTLTALPREFHATQEQHPLSPVLYCFPQEIFLPVSSLYHSILGSGFPSTGHVNVFTIPSATKTVSPLFVASTGSLRKKKTQQKAAINWLDWLQLKKLQRYLGITVHRKSELTSGQRTGLPQM